MTTDSLIAEVRRLRADNIAPQSSRNRLVALTEQLADALEAAMAQVAELKAALEWESRLVQHAYMPDPERCLNCGGPAGDPRHAESLAAMRIGAIDWAEACEAERDIVLAREEAAEDLLREAKVLGGTLIESVQRAEERVRVLEAAAIGVRDVWHFATKDVRELHIPAEIVDAVDQLCAALARAAAEPAAHEEKAHDQR